MPLTFRITIEEADSPSMFIKWAKANDFPKDFSICELELLSMIRMSRSRNKSLYDRLAKWYGSIDQKFRLI